MDAELKIVLSSQPDKDNLDSARLIASKVTDDINSIKMDVEKENKFYCIILQFTMTEIKQSQAVDIIDKELRVYKYSAGDYQDSTISFSRR